jgi:hypothetical protein
MKTNFGNTFVLKFNSWGSNLATRAVAEPIRIEIEKKISLNIFVTFDFTGVQVISNAFADECFGKLFDRFDVAKVKKNSHFKNTSPFVKIVISSAVSPKINSKVIN